MTLDSHDDVYGVPLDEFRVCPQCKSVDQVALYLIGLPARPPYPHEVDRVVFGGCVVGEGPDPYWWCRECQIGFTKGGRIVEVTDE